MNENNDRLNSHLAVTGMPRRASTDAVNQLLAHIIKRHYCFLPGRKTRALLGYDEASVQTEWHAFSDSWNRLGVDPYMRDNGRYRKRRHAVYSAEAASHTLHREPHQPHYQSLDYNPLNGGIARHYLPIEDSLAMNPVFVRILRLCCEVFGRLRPENHWHIEIHQFRIEAIGLSDARPTPEGIHRDGVHFVLMLMVRRQNIVNGETGIYTPDGTCLDHFTLADEWDTAIINDHKIKHGVSPIVQLNTDTPGIRDVLVVTFRSK